MQSITIFKKIINKFTAHPNEVGESYFGHLKFTIYNVLNLFRIGLVLFLHGVFPFIFISYTKDKIAILHNKLFKRSLEPSLHVDENIENLIGNNSILKIKSLKLDEIYLASKSPRRSELLKQIDIAYELLLFDIPEIVIPGETPIDYSKRITKEKCDAGWNKIVAEQLPPRPVLCADTEVVLENIILGKASSYDEAFTVLKSYSNKSHEVITTIGLKYYDYEKIITNTTIVSFSYIPDEEIHKYLATGDYKDKSGSYGIQSYISQFITDINGCFYSVMGLPLNSVREILSDFHSNL